MGDTQSRSSRDRVQVLRAVAGVLLIVGCLLIVLLVLQFIDVFFTLGNPAVVDDGDVRRFEATASACVAVLGASLLLAVLSRRRTLAWAAGAVLLLGMLVVVLFAVPQTRWAPVEESHPLPTNYEPCYSGSTDCGGGG